MVNDYKTVGSRIFDTCNIFFFLFASFVFLYPFYNLVVDSFSTPAAAMLVGFKFWPAEFSLAAYERVLKSPAIWIGYGNTVLVTACSWLLGLTLSVCGAYPLSRRNLPNRQFWTFVVVATMFFDGGLVPSYLLVKNLGLMNTYAALIVPGAISTWNLILVRNYFMALPGEMEEAASIDGAGTVRTLCSIILPLSKPILATISLFIIVSHWNAWFACMLYIRDTNKYVLQVVLKRIIELDSREFISAVNDAAENNNISYDRITVKAATIMVATLPILCIYPFMQKYFIKGIMVGSLKG